MKVGENYIIKSDKYQWILQERYLGKDKNGGEKFQFRENYYPRLENCLTAIIQRDLKQSENLTHIIELLKKAETKITLAIKEMKDEN